MTLHINIKLCVFFQFGNNNNYMNMAEANNAFFAAVNKKPEDKRMTMMKEIGRLDYGLAKIGLPLLRVCKDNHGLFFLVDSGASHNIIRKDDL